MKKVFIGLGIGCGVLILGVIAAVVVGGVWVAKKAGGSIEAVQKMQVQQKEMAELNKSHPFEAPAEGDVLSLQEERLLTYLSVRESALPVFKTYEEKSKAFQEEHDTKNADANPSFNAAMEAANLAMGMMADVRTAYIASLKKNGMSPNEFQTITSTVYASMVAEGSEAVQKMSAKAVEAMQKQLKMVDGKLENAKLSAEERAELEESRTGLQEQIEALSDAANGTGAEGLSDAAKQAAAANMALLKKHEERVKVMANAAFDGFVLGGATDELSGAGAGADGELQD
ncbi:hypothetical protein HUA76_03865 [Myxococcus sp. CA056]|uniref:hypothetical protein n=1 Tax=unclassified Myxococcus TaxID=2648731 RepID=UPI00157BA9F8|nr:MULTISPECIES: hypothetical protein [unclassified Myxococcus]NTX09915.1 hypothetical protein [Myxococcus sp. CA056]NTX35278.1 hypothetical protein [Myxococcus sp. CA033]NTX57091.1 hypothetical protein [Myxococcus sp. CA039A]